MYLCIIDVDAGRLQMVYGNRLIKESSIPSVYDVCKIVYADNMNTDDLLQTVFKKAKSTLIVEVYLKFISSVIAKVSREWNAVFIELRGDIFKSAVAKKEMLALLEDAEFSQPIPTFKIAG